MTTVSTRWDRLSQREKRLATAAAGVFVAFVTAIFVYLIWDGLADLETKNEAMREALAAIEKNREVFMAARRLATQQETRISRVPLQLGTMVEAAAHEAGITANDISDQPPVPHGKKYVQKGVEVKFRQVDLVALSKFMKKIETGMNLVYVSRLNIKSRFGEHSKLDAEMVISAFENAPEAGPKKPKPGAAPAGAKPGREDDTGPEKT